MYDVNILRSWKMICKKSNQGLALCLRSRWIEPARAVGSIVAAAMSNSVLVCSAPDGGPVAHGSHLRAWLASTTPVMPVVVPGGDEDFTRTPRSGPTHADRTVPAGGRIILSAGGHSGSATSAGGWGGTSVGESAVRWTIGRCGTNKLRNRPRGRL